MHVFAQPNNIKQGSRKQKAHDGRGHSKRQRVAHNPESERETKSGEGARQRASDERGGENDEGSATTTKRGGVSNREEGITQAQVLR